MSTDRRVTKDLIQTLEDGKEGFTRAAEKLAESDRPDLSTTMRKYADQRGAFSAELDKMAADYGDDIDEDGSVGGAIHRGWMAVKDAISGSDPKGVLDAAEQGEDHAVSEYKDALDKQDISPNLREVIQRQYADIQKAHDDIKALRNAND
ncbi:MAG: PA2169 family four-helix-bundle protein [Ilumatobacteraceae bacterium]